MHADHAFIHSFSQSVSHSVIQSFSHSVIHLFIHSFIRSLVHSFVRSFIHSFIRSFIDSCIHLPRSLPPSLHPCRHYITLHHIHIQNISKWGDAVRWKMAEIASAHIRPDHERTSHSSRPCWQRFPQIQTSLRDQTLQPAPKSFQIYFCYWLHWWLMFFDRCSFGGKLSTPTGVALSDSGSELGGRNGQANSRYVVRKKGYTRNPMIYHHFPC